MKNLHNQPESQKTIVESVSSWYKWMIENKPSSVNHSTEIISSEIGHISNKSVSVKIQTKDENGTFYDVYVTPKGFFIKGHMNGKTYRFKKEFMQAIESFVQE